VPHAGHHLILPGTGWTSVRVCIGETGGGGAEEEGAILGNDSKKGLLPARLPSWREAAEQVEQQSTESHLCQPFPLHLGHIPGLSLCSIHFISKQKDHSSILNTFLQKKE